MPEISKIKLPSGGVYDIKDATAREMISGGVSFIVAWDGASTPVPGNIPKDVTVTYNGTTYTGTLAANSATTGAFYLIRSSTEAGVLDTYDEYVPVGETGSKTWEKIGDTQVDLSDVVTDVTLSKQTATVLGSSATFQVPKTNISFTGGTTDRALGEATTFALTNGDVTFDTPTTETFVKSVSAETGKNLVTTSITPTNGTETVSKVTQSNSKLVTTSIPNVTGNTSVTIPNVTSVGTSSTWTFTMGSGADAETLIINGANSTAPTLGADLTATNTTLGTAITAATGSVATTGTGAAVVTSVSISNKTVAKVGTAVTVATGETSTAGTGAAVVTGVTVGSSGTAIVAMPNASVGTAITVGTNDKITAITSIGTGSLPSTSVSVTAKDQKTVLTSTTDVAVTKGKS